MIPADVASRLQVSADTTLRPVAPAQEISDRLSGLVAGQRVMAEIQAMLPNGTYRAMINQRNITLALPFSAKSGDSLELMVTENDGRLALAVLSRAGVGEQSATTESASATLSRAGQLIGELFANARGAREGGNAVPLNASRPILSAPPGSAAELAPLLKQAISQSGMFYEAHQVEWFAGRFAKAALLQEPQGMLSKPTILTEAQAGSAASVAATAKQASQAEGLPQPATQTETTAKPTALAADKPAETAQASRPTMETLSAAGTAGAETGKTAATQQSAAQMIAPQLQHLVQQQLEALATQHFSWQGQAWPGQEMRWEIDEDAARQGLEGEDETATWATRLRLHLPNLGEVDARIRLQGSQLALSVCAASEMTRTLMRSAGPLLGRQLEAAGLSLATLGVEDIERAAEETGDEADA